MLAGRSAITAVAIALGWCFTATAAEADPSATKFFQGRNFDIPDPAQGGRGGEIYLSHCASCHDEGLARAPQRYLFSTMSPQSIYRALKAGAMQGQAEDLSDADKVTVAEFLTRKKIGDASDAPEPPACKGKAAKFDVNEPPIFSTWGLSPGATRFIPGKLAGIDKTNVGRLQLKWAVSFPNAVQVRSEPALAAGALYVGSHNGGVYALDRASGCARWIFQGGSEVRTGVTVSPWKAGDRKAKPLVYFGDVFGFVYAVDAQTGKQVWRVRADEHPNITATGAPTLYGDTLYVPVSSMEGVRPADPSYECCTSRGAVVAYNAATGEVKWKTYSTDTPKLIGKTVKGTNRYGPAGASIWNSPVIDAKRGQLYIGTGGNSASPASDTSDAIIALDIATGAKKWIYQGLPGDATNLACLSEDRSNCPDENGPDYDFGAGIILATAADGREVVIGGQKSGDVHAVDPDTGKLIWRQKPGRGGSLGGVHFGMAVANHTVFVPINDALDRQHNGELYTEPAHPGLYAFDVGTGTPVWTVHGDPSTCAGLKGCTPGYSQAITATPDLVFAGSNDGWLRAFDAKTGNTLWQVEGKKAVKTVTGLEKSGGAFGGGAGPILYHGMLFASSGYNRAGMVGNLLLAYEIK
jgi:polyvinyl alcohol dehydrogenase (cytochrome)